MSLKYFVILLFTLSFGLQAGGLWDMLPHFGGGANERLEQRILEFKNNNKEVSSPTDDNTETLKPASNSANFGAGSTIGVEDFDFERYEELKKKRDEHTISFLERFELIKLHIKLFRLYLFQLISEDTKGPDTTEPTKGAAKNVKTPGMFTASGGGEPGKPSDTGSETSQQQEGGSAGAQDQRHVKLIADNNKANALTSYEIPGYQFAGGPEDLNLWSFNCFDPKLRPNSAERDHVSVHMRADWARLKNTRLDGVTINHLPGVVVVVDDTSEAYELEANFPEHALSEGVTQARDLYVVGAPHSHGMLHRGANEAMRMGLKNAAGEYGPFRFEETEYSADPDDKDQDHEDNQVFQRILEAAQNNIQGQFACINNGGVVSTMLPHASVLNTWFVLRIRLERLPEEPKQRRAPVPAPVPVSTLEEKITILVRTPDEEEATELEVNPRSVTQEDLENLLAKQENGGFLKNSFEFSFGDVPIVYGRPLAEFGIEKDGAIITAREPAARHAAAGGGGGASAARSYGSGHDASYNPPVVSVAGMTITRVDCVRMHVVTSADKSFVPDLNRYLKIVQKEEKLLEKIKAAKAEAAKKHEEYVAKNLEQWREIERHRQQEARKKLRESTNFPDGTRVGPYFPEFGPTPPHKLAKVGLNLRVDCDCGVKDGFVQIGKVENSDLKAFVSSNQFACPDPKCKLKPRFRGIVVCASAAQHAEFTLHGEREDVVGKDSETVIYSPEDPIKEICLKNRWRDLPSYLNGGNWNKLFVSCVPFWVEEEDTSEESLLKGRQKQEGGGGAASSTSTP